MVERFCPHILEETQEALPDALGVKGELEWTSVKAFPVMQNITCRILNRVISGADVCRNPEFTQTCMNLSFEIITTSLVLNMLHEGLRRVVSPWIGRMDKFINEAEQYLEPAIEERKMLKDAAPVSQSNYSMSCQSLNCHHEG
jgi:hypothetical protein